MKLESKREFVWSKKHNAVYTLGANVRDDFFIGCVLLSSWYNAPTHWIELKYEALHVDDISGHEFPMIETDDLDSIPIKEVATPRFVLPVPVKYKNIIYLPQSMDISYRDVRAISFKSIDAVPRAGGWNFPVYQTAYLKREGKAFWL